MKSKAVAALLRGASRGDADAMIRLSAVYLCGQGVARDAAEALRWAQAAAGAGSSRGAYVAATMLLAAKPDKAEEAEALALLAMAADAGYAPAAEAYARLAGPGRK